MAKKKGKKKGKGGKGRAHKATPTRAAGDRDTAAAAEAEQNVTQDASSSTDAGASGPILTDGVPVDEDVRRQEAEGLNKIDENETLVDEANPMKT